MGRPARKPSDSLLVSGHRFAALTAARVSDPALGAPSSAAAARVPWRWPVALPLLLGLAALYGPTYWDFLFGFWTAESQGHELLVVAVSAWLFHRRTGELRALASPGRPVVAALVLALGLAAYAVGRYLSQLHVNSRIELSSQFLVLLALLLAYRGWRGLRVVWFPLLFLLFAMPLPGGLATAVTAPLKQAVSASAVALLGLLDYPVGRSGVVITIGQYQLLVAEACAGLQTLFTLEAVGLLYVNLMAYRSAWRTALMSVLAVPAAFLANVVRVTTLVLVTYHFGDAAGQGFMHRFAGIVLFVVALGLLMGLNRLSERFFGAAQ
jgi:exosortase B